MLTPLGSLGVALRKESVDRNAIALALGGGHGVALRKESVDRNPFDRKRLYRRLLSLSARRAWIEIWSVASRNNPGHRRSPQGERG